MKKTLIKSLAITVGILCSGLYNLTAFACTSVLAGKNATEDGSVMISRNEDMSNAWAKHFIVHHPNPDHMPQYYKATDNDFSYWIADLYSYTATPDWDAETGGVFEEDGINENQVAVSATESASNNKTVRALDPWVEGGITESSIPTVLLPQVKTAREGILLMGKIIEEVGAGEGIGMAVADAKEAWYLECGSGHQWVAVRIPDDSYMVAANQFRINHIDLSDTNNYLGSDIITFAKEKGLYKESDGDFNFAKIFGTDSATDFASNYPRVWFGEKMLTPSANLEYGKNDYPLFLKPDKKITPADIMAVLRSHYNGTQYDNDAAAKASVDQPRPINVRSTMESHILQLRGWLPNPIGGVHWLDLGVPETSAYVRFYSGITDTPAEYKLGTDEYDSTSAYWNFRSLNALTATHFSKYSPNVISAFSDFENKEFSEQDEIDKQALDLYNKDLNKCLEFITNYSNNLAKEAMDIATKLKNEIITKMTSEVKVNP